MVIQGILKVFSSIVRACQGVFPHLLCGYPPLDPSKKRMFTGRISRGRPGVIRADIPGQKLRAGPPNPGKTSIWVRTSMTWMRGCPWPQGVHANFGQKNFRLIFRSLLKSDERGKYFKEFDMTAWSQFHRCPAGSTGTSTSLLSSLIRERPSGKSKCKRGA